MRSNSDDGAVIALGCVGALVVFPVLTVIGAIANGWALSILWSWFIVSTFHVTSLSIVQAIGLTYVVSYLVHQEVPDSDSEKKGGFWSKIGIAFLKTLLKPIVTLAFGAIVHHFMVAQ